MLKFIICAIISFSLGLFTSTMMKFIKRRKKYKQKTRYKKVKPLNQQDFKQAMKDLEIK